MTKTHATFGVFVASSINAEIVVWKCAQTMLCRLYIQQYDSTVQYACTVLYMPWRQDVCLSVGVSWLVAILATVVYPLLITVKGEGKTGLATRSIGKKKVCRPKD